MIPIAQVVLEEDEIEAVVRVLRSGQLRQGPITAEFERRFATSVGARYAVAVSSGTAALHVAYAALLQPGDEVLVPAFTFFATASMVSAVGAKPIFCDVDPHTFTLDVDDARRRMTPRTRAIAPVHLFGTPAHIEEIQRLAGEHNLRIVWDAAQAHGARYRGKDIGSFDDVVCYSFYPTKNMTTGEGGMITTNDEEIYRRCRLIRDHGQEAKYYHTMLGFNYRMTDIAAALGIRQLQKVAGWVQKRRQNARYLTEHLHDVPGIQVPVERPGAESSFSLYTIALDLEQFACDRDEFMGRLHEKGVGASVHYPRPLHHQPFYRAEYGHLSLPVSESLSARVLSLPVHPKLTQEDLDRIVEAVREVAEEARRSAAR